MIRESLRVVTRGQVALATVTAPGGMFDTVESAAWNTEAAPNWRRLRDRIKREMRRRHDLRPPVVLVRVAQRQARGLDHLHIVWWVLTPEHRHRIHVWIELYREYADAYGFGYIDDPYKMRRNRKTGRVHNMVFEDPATCGYYLGNYLAGGQLERYIAAEDTSWSPVWISPAIQHRSGWSLQRCRWIRQAWHLSRGTWNRKTAWGSLDLPSWMHDEGHREWVCAVTGWDGLPGSRAPQSLAA